MAALWNTIATRRPRMARTRSDGAATMSSPMSAIRPASRATRPGRSRRIALASDDLADPLSPTRPTISPRPIRSDTSVRMRIGPAAVA